MPLSKNADSGWIRFKLVDTEGRPAPGERYVVRTADGLSLEGRLDVNGECWLEGIDPGDCNVSFPELDADEWHRA